ncbi:MAG: hypothetical protein F4237_12515 [Gemmatimonadetes bacterium]|nr:hypothetical protein [Gemmatimonadota bacterium]
MPSKTFQEALEATELDTLLKNARDRLAAAVTKAQDTSDLAPALKECENAKNDLDAVDTWVRENATANGNPV